MSPQTITMALVRKRRARATSRKLVIAAAKVAVLLVAFWGCMFLMAALADGVSSAIGG